MASQMLKKTILWSVVSRRCYYTNVEAAQSIKNLYSKRSSSKGFPSKHQVAVLQEAMEIYGDIMEPVNEYVMNTMLSLMLHCKQSDEVVKLWQDLPRIITERKSPQITFSLMLKCFACSKKEIGPLLLPLLDTLRWIQDYHRYLAISQQEYSTLISRIIRRFNVNRDTLLRIHSLIDHRFINDIFIKTALINGYRKHNDLESAVNIFESIPRSQRDAVCNSTMMSIYIENGHSQNALDLYHDIEHEDRDHVIHCMAFKACTELGDLEKGNVIRNGIGSISGRGAIDVLNAMITFYGKCGSLQDAVDIFDDIPNHKKNVITMGAMMAVFVDHHHPLDALQIYENVHVFNPRIRRNEICHILAVKSCVLSDDKESGKRIISSLEMDKIKEIKLINSIIDFHGHFRDVESAHNVFQSVVNRADIGTINTMMDCYFRSNLHIQCIELFREIIVGNGLKPDVTSFSLVLAACSMDEEWFHFGHSIHRELLNGDKSLQWMLRHLSIQIHLINLYAKNGRVEMAQQIFDDIKANENEKYRTEISIWNAMLNAFAINGDAERCKALFDCMVNEVGLQPIKKSYAILFNAFSHSDYIETAVQMWKHMDSGTETKYDEYICGSLIDGLSRKGPLYLMKAYKLILKYERFSHQRYNDVMWTSLLSGAVKHNRTETARRIHEKYLQRFGDDEQYSQSLEAAATLMSNL